MPMTGGKIGQAPPPAAQERPVQQIPPLADSTPEVETTRMAQRAERAERRRLRQDRSSEAQTARGLSLCMGCEAYHEQDSRYGLCRLRPPFSQVRAHDWCMQFEQRLQDPEFVAPAELEVPPPAELPPPAAPEEDLTMPQGHVCGACGKICKSRSGLVAHARIH